MLAEHERVFERLDLEQAEQFMDRILAAGRVFVHGAGREGIALRSFAMRLMHLGKEVHWLWDDTTPGMGPDDLFIISDGCGEIGHLRYLAGKARENKTHLCMITSAPSGSTVRDFADSYLFIPCRSYNSKEKNLVESAQPMGNLYEQHLFLLMDLMVILLAERGGITHQAMETRHRNIE